MKTQKAFTLIELLVVMAIIAALAGMAFPAFRNAIRQGKLTDATAKARQIGLGLRMYSGDHEGMLPNDRNDYEEPIRSSNDAFRSLVPHYVDSEQVFVLGSSKVGAKADDLFDSPSQILKRGENHWAYVAGLSTSSPSNWPMIVDHTDGSGRYSTMETEVGGTWNGLNAVVIRVDLSASAVGLRGTGNKRFLPRREDQNKNALMVTEYMGQGARVLEPAR